MASVILEFDYDGKKVKRFNIRNLPDDIFWLTTGDEIGFDLVDGDEYFYTTVSRKVYLAGTNKPLYVVCIPTNFDSIDELESTLDGFKKHFGEDLSIDANTITA
jgi:hypothetical protein